MTTRAAVVWIAGFSFVAFAVLLAERGTGSPHADKPAPATTDPNRPKPQPAAILSPGAANMRAGSQRKSLPPFPTGSNTPHRGDTFRNDDDRQPGRLAAPGNAAPLESRNMNLATLRAAIRQELPHASPTEIDLWVRELKGMQLHSALDLLRVRRQFPLRGETTGPNLVPLPLDAPQISPREPSLLPRYPESPVFSQPHVTSHFQASVAALQQGLDAILNNIANANTPGFKRSRVVFGELPPVEVPNSNSHTDWIGVGVTVMGIPRDWSQGKLRKTGRPLDAAIDGEGFFAVRSGSTTLYTRYGSFHWGASRQLELRIGGVSFPLASNGVPNRPGGMEGISIASIPNPDGLKPLGNGLFATTSASGSPRLGMMAGIGGPGRLKTGYLEEANVDLEKEMQQFQRIARQIKTLKTALSVLSDGNRPATSPRPVVKRRIPPRSAIREPTSESDSWWPWR